MPWRNTNAFWAPMAAINAKDARNPTIRGELMPLTLGNRTV